MPYHVSTSSKRVDSFTVQHGDSESYRIGTDEYVVLKKEWRGGQLLNVAAIRRYPNTPDGFKQAKSHAAKLQKELGG